MDAVVVIAVLAVLIAVPVLLWRIRRSRLARGLGDSGRFYNGVFGLGGGAADPIDDGGIHSSAPPRPRR